MPHCNDKVCQRSTRYDGNDERVCDCNCSTCEGPASPAKRREAKPAAANDVPPAHRPPPDRTLGMVILFVGIGAGTMWWQKSREPLATDPVQAAETPATPASPPSSGLRVGDRVVLFSTASPGKNVPLASTADTFVRFAQLVKAGGKDLSAADEVLERMWQVPPKTAAKVIEVVENGYRVEIVGGSADGDRGYVITSMTHAP